MNTKQCKTLNLKKKDLKILYLTGHELAAIPSGLDKQTQGALVER